MFAHFAHVNGGDSGSGGGTGVFVLRPLGMIWIVLKAKLLLAYCGYQHTMACDQFIRN